MIGLGIYFVTALDSYDVRHPTTLVFTKQYSGGDLVSRVDFAVWEEGELNCRP